MVRKAPRRISESDSSGSEDSRPIQVGAARSSSGSSVLVIKSPVAVPEVVLEPVASPPPKRRRVGAVTSCSVSQGDRSAGDSAPTTRGIPEVRSGSAAEQGRSRRRQPYVPEVPVHGLSRRGSTSPVRHNRRAERVPTIMPSGVTPASSPVVTSPPPIIASPGSFRLLCSCKSIHFFMR